MFANQSRQSELRHLYGTDTLEEFRARFGFSRYFQWWAARIGARLIQLEVERFLLLNQAVCESKHDNNNSDLVIRVVSLSEMSAYAGVRHDIDASFLGQRDSRRDVCLGAFHNRELAAYGWFTRFPHDLRLPENMAYTFKAFTLPHFRGMGIQAKIKRAALEHFGQFGVSRFLTIVNWINWPSQRACLRVGFQPIGQSISLRIGTRDFEYRSKAIRRVGIFPSSSNQWHADDGTWNDRSTENRTRKAVPSRLAETAAYGE